MRNLLAALGLAFAFSMTVFPQPANDDPDLETAHRLWATYFSHSCSGTVSLVDAVLAPDFMFVASNGELTSRREYLREVGCTSSEVSSTDDVQKRIYNGDSAVVTGRLIIKPASFVGPNDERIFRYTNVYVKTPKRWQLVHSQFARIVHE